MPAASSSTTTVLNIQIHNTWLPPKLSQDMPSEMQVLFICHQPDVAWTVGTNDHCAKYPVGVVVFMVKSKYDDYRLSMKMKDLLDRALGMHKPPLKAKLINNGPINTRGDGTLAFPFNDGVEYELEAETLPGKALLVVHQL